jgi:hypothetical protein
MEQMTVWLQQGFGLGGAHWAFPLLMHHVNTAASCDCYLTVQHLTSLHQQHK